MNVLERDGAVQFDVQVVPRASREKLGPVIGDRLKIALTAPPVDGAANDALRDALARALSVPRSAVEIVRGETSRKKTVRVRGITRASLMSVIGEAG